MLWSITTRGLDFSSSELLGTFSNQTPRTHLSLQGKQAELLKDKSGVALLPSKNPHYPHFFAFFQDPEEKVPTYDILSQDAVTSSCSLLWNGSQCRPQWEISGDQQNHQH